MTAIASVLTIQASTISWLSEPLKKILLLFVIGTGILAHTLSRYAVMQGMCLASAPYAPQPPDQTEIIDGRVTLQWQIDCAVNVEVWMNGALIATLDGTVTAYTVDVQAGDNRWQIVALDEVGTRVSSAVWHIERDTGGWLATPQPLSTEGILYTPPAPPLIRLDLNSPSVLVMVVCGSSCSGLGLVISVAWLLGVRAQRREHQRRWYR